MKYTFAGKTGRAQLTVMEPSRQGRRTMFRVRLLPRRASWNTSYASAGDQAYLGPDLEMALIHIRAWTGDAHVEMPAALRKYADATAESIGIFTA